MLLDFTRQSDYLLAFLPEIVLTLAAMAVLLGDVLQKGSKSAPSASWVPWASLGGVVLAALANAYMAINVHEAAPTGVVAVDSFRVFTNFVLLLACALSILISVGYVDREGINRGEFYVLQLFATLGMMLMAGARELVLMFIALEVMSLAVYVLTGFNRRDPRSSEASLKYFLLGAFSSAFFLYGIALVLGATGSTHLSVIAPMVLGGSALLQTAPMLLVGIALLAVGLAFKVAAVPFHMWAADAYDGAPTPISALMSTGVKAAAFAAFIRVFPVAFGGLYDNWSHVIWWLAAITMVGGNLIAITQGSVKRMLAYSSIAHAGYVLVALLAANSTGAAAFLFYLLVYTLMTAGAFAMVTANSTGGAERVRLEDFAGFGWKQPLLGAAFAIFLLSLAGFPLTAGFVGKVYILRSALEAGQGKIAVVLVLASLLSYFYYLRVVVTMYMRPAESEEQFQGLALSPAAKFAIVASAVAVLVLFFYPSPTLDAAQKSVASLFASVGAQYGLLP